MSKLRSRGAPATIACALQGGKAYAKAAMRGGKSPFRRARLPALLLGTTALSLTPAIPAKAEVCDGGTAIVVDGAGGGNQPSPWNTTNQLTIGLDSECTLTIQNGGEVNTPFNTGHVTIAQNVNSEGTITITGENSALRLTGTGSQSGQPGIVIGNRGIGTMTISEGGYVESFGGRLGVSPGAVGTVVVTGDGSRWDSRGIIVGGVSAGFTQNGGEGHLTIAAGGVVTSNGWTFVGNNGKGTMLVTGEGSTLEIVNQDLRVGNLAGGEGEVTITDGATVTSDRGHIGYPGGKGSVTVSGGASWTMQDMLTLGTQGGTGDLLITGGGIVRMAESTFTKSISVGDSDGTGRLEVTGAGSLLNFDGTLYIARSDTSEGELLVADEARLETGAGAIGGYYSNSLGDAEATVTDGAAWASTGGIGLRQHGRLTISAGGQVQSQNGRIGTGSTESGAAVAVAVVTGAGSAWTTGAGGLVVGQMGAGTLSITDGGAIRVGETGTGTLTIAQNSQSAGLLNLGAAEGEAPGLATLEAGRIAFGAGDGALVINRAGAHQLDAVISGPADKGIIRHLAGTTVLTSDSRDFRGATILTGGTLHVEQILGGDVEVGAGARLSGGDIGGAVEVSGGALAPGNSPGMMTIGGNLVLDAASTLEFELGAPDGTPGGDSDLIQVASDLTLDGTLNVTDAGGFGEGLYRLIDYGGALTDNGLDIGAAPTGFDDANLTVQTGIDKQVNLLVGAPIGAASFFFWDGADATGNGDIDGGAGVWTATDSNWTIADGGANGAFDPGELLIFAGAPGEVTVDDSAGAIAVSGGLQFAVDGYAIAGDEIRLDGIATIRVGDGTDAGAGVTATIASTIAGSNGLDKTDLGTLVLAGINTYTGDTAISGGTLRVSADAALGGGANGVRLNGAQNGATLAFASAMSSARDFTAGTGGGTLLIEDGAVELSGLLAGGGDLAKRGAGLLHYTGDGSAFTGGFALAEGALRLDGTLAGSLATSAGTTLSGVGEVDNLRVGGRLEPGASIGTLTVARATPPGGLTFVPLAVVVAGAPGDLTLANGSTYVVELNDGGSVAGVNNDLVVAETATVESGVTIHVTPENGTDTGGTYVPGTAYTVIRTGAAGDLTVEAQPTITDAFALLDFTGRSDGRNYYLTSQPVANFCLPGSTFNQCSTANAVQDLGAGHAAFDSVLLLSEADARAAFDAMSGEAHATVQHGIDQSFALFNRTLRFQGVAGAANVGANGAGPSRDTDNASARGAWAAPLGAFGEIDGDGNAARFEWWNAGLASGYESAIELGSGDAIGGLGLAYIRSHGAIDDRRSTVDGDGFYLGAYGAWAGGPWAVAATVAYGANRLAIERGIVVGAVNETATASYWAHTVGLSGEAAYAFDLSDGARLMPLLTFETGWSGHDGFTERGAGVFGLGSGSESWTRLDGGAGLALTHTFPTDRGATRLEGRAVWEHAFGDLMPDIMNRFAGAAGHFEIRGPTARADRLRLGASLSSDVSGAMTVRARYDGLVSGDQNSHAVSAGLAIRF